MAKEKSHAHHKSSLKGGRNGKNGVLIIYCGTEVPTDSPYKKITRRIARIAIAR